MVLGPVEFVAEPICNLLNGVNITELNSTAWFLNEKTVLTHNIVLDQINVGNNIELLVG